MSAKVILTLTFLVACLAQKRDEQVSILQYDNEGVNHDGSYKFSYRTGHGIHAEESGYVKQLQGRSKEESEAQVMQGSYSYTGPDGVLYTVNYIADENGFRAEGAHLPAPTNYGEGARRPIPPTLPTLRPPLPSPGLPQPPPPPPAPGLPPVRVG